MVTKKILHLQFGSMYKRMKAYTDKKILHKQLYTSYICNIYTK